MRRSSECCDLVGKQVDWLLEARQRLFRLEVSLPLIQMSEEAILLPLQPPPVDWLSEPLQQERRRLREEHVVEEGRKQRLNRELTAALEIPPQEVEALLRRRLDKAVATCAQQLERDGENLREVAEGYLTFEHSLATQWLQADLQAADAERHLQSRARQLMKRGSEAISSRWREQNKRLAWWAAKQRARDRELQLAARCFFHACQRDTQSSTVKLQTRLSSLYSFLLEWQREEERILKPLEAACPCAVQPLLDSVRSGWRAGEQVTAQLHLLLTSALPLLQRSSLEYLQLPTECAVLQEGVARLQRCDQALLEFQQSLSCTLLQVTLYLENCCSSVASLECSWRDAFHHKEEGAALHDQQRLLRACRKRGQPYVTALQRWQASLGGSVQFLQQDPQWQRLLQQKEAQQRQEEQVVDAVQLQFRQDADLLAEARQRCTAWTQHCVEAQCTTWKEQVLRWRRSWELFLLEKGSNKEVQCFRQRCVLADALEKSRWVQRSRDHLCKRCKELS